MPVVLVPPGFVDSPEMVRAEDLLREIVRVTGATVAAGAAVAGDIATFQDAIRTAGRPPETVLPPQGAGNVPLPAPAPVPGPRTNPSASGVSWGAFAAVALAAVVVVMLSRE